MIGPSFSGKTYLMLKFVPRIPPPRDIYIITKSRPEQYSNSKIKNKEVSAEIKPPSEHENAIIVFDDFSHLSQSQFDLPRRTI